MRTSLSLWMILFLTLPVSASSFSYIKYNELSRSSYYTAKTIYFGVQTKSQVLGLNTVSILFQKKGNATVELWYREGPIKDHYFYNNGVTEAISDGWEKLGETELYITDPSKLQEIDIPIYKITDTNSDYSIAIRSNLLFLADYTRHSIGDSVSNNATAELIIGGSSYRSIFSSSYIYNDFPVLSLKYSVGNPNPPPKPIITSLEDGNHTVTSNRVVISGTGQNASFNVTKLYSGNSSNPKQNLIGTSDSESASFTVTSNVLNEGSSHTLYVTETNGYGQESDPSTQNITITIDTTPYATPQITAPLGTITTRNLRPTISLTIEAGSKTLVFSDKYNSPIATISAGSASTVQVKPNADLSEKTHAITAISRDEYGNDSNASTQNLVITIDQTPPPRPVLVSPLNSYITLNNKPDIVATNLELGTTVKLYSESTLLATSGTIDKTSNFVFTPSTEIADGPYSNVHLKAEDSANNTSTASTQNLNLVIDTVSTTPQITAPNNNTITQNTTPVFSGTAEANAVVSIFKDGSLVSTVNCNSVGAWSKELPSQNDGNYNFQVTAKDPVGNISASSNLLSVKIDTVIDPPIIIVPKTSISTLSTIVTISGSSEEKASLKIFSNGIQLGSATADGSGDWSYDYTFSNYDIKHVITANATDEAGNISTSSTQNIYIRLKEDPFDLDPKENTLSTLGTSSFYIDQEGKLWASGKNEEGVFGLGNTTAKTEYAVITKNVLAVETGEDHILILKKDGTVYGAGKNANGELGLGNTTSPQKSFQEIATDVSKISAGNNHSLILKKDGKLFSTGLNDRGQLGLNHLSSKSSLSLVAEQVIDILGRGDHSLFIRFDDVLWAAGDNQHGQLGLTKTSDANAHKSPSLVTEDIKAIYGSASSLFVHRLDYKVFVSGDNQHGQLGLGNTNAVNTLTELSGNYKYIYPGLNHSFFLMPDDSLKVVGKNTSKHLALGSSAGNVTSLQDVTTNALIVGSAQFSSQANSLLIKKDLSFWVSGANTNHSIGQSNQSINYPKFTQDTNVDTVYISQPPIFTSPVGSSHVNSTTVSIAGTAAQGVTVNIFANGILKKSHPTGSKDSFSTSIPLAENSSPYVITGNVLNSAGNTSDSSIQTISVIVDTTAPTKPIIQSPSSSLTTSNSTPTISGNGEIGSIVQVFAGGTLLGTTTVTANGHWTIQSSTLSHDSSYTITAKAKDLAGNESSAHAPGVTIKADLETDKPEISSPSPDHVTNNASPTINGTAEAGATVELFYGPGTSLVASSNVDGSGNWALKTSSDTSHGTKTMFVKATDDYGNTADSESQSLEIDIISESPTITVPVHQSNTNNNSITILGSGEKNATVRLYLNGKLEKSLTTDTNSGSFSHDLSYLDDGVYTITANATDSFSNPSQTPTFVSFNVDTRAPKKLFILNPIYASVTNNTKPLISGTVVGAASITIYNDNTPLIESILVSGNDWSSNNYPALSHGTYNISVKAFDLAGNATPFHSPVLLVIDTVTPNAPIITEPGSISGQNSQTLTFKGSSEPLSTIELYSSTSESGSFSLLATGNTRTDSNWELSNTSELSNSTYYIKAKSIDSAGNESFFSSIIQVQVDTNDISTEQPVLTSPGNYTISNNNKPVFSGNVENNASIKLYEENREIGNTTADNDGNFQVTASELTDGDYSITVVATDLFNNVSLPSIPLLLSIDTVTPNIPIIETPISSSLHNTDTPTFKGQAEANTTVILYSGSTVIASGNSNSEGKWLIIPPSRILIHGITYPITAKSIDAAGNSSDSSAPSFISIDIFGPENPIIHNERSYVSTNNTKPTISGTAESHSSIYLLENNKLIKTLSTDTGDWAYQIPTDLSDGTYTYTAYSTDSVGNLSGHSNPMYLIIDTIKPNKPSVTRTLNGVFSNNNMPEFSGTGVSYNQVVLYANGQEIAAGVINGDGLWTVKPNTPLPDSEIILTVVEKDAAGNISDSTASLTFTIDTIVPEAPSFSNEFQDLSIVTSSSQPIISGVTEAKSSVEVFLDDISIGNATVNTELIIPAITHSDKITNSSLVSWSFQIPYKALDEHYNPAGHYIITAKSTDLATNTSSFSDKLSLKVVGFSSSDAPLDFINPLVGPNPVNPDKDSIVFQYNLTQDADISIYIFSLSGDLIWSKDYSKGQDFTTVKLINTIPWQVSFDASPYNLSPGVYIAYLIAKTEGEIVKKVFKIAILK